MLAIAEILPTVSPCHQCDDYLVAKDGTKIFQEVSHTMRWLKNKPPTPTEWEPEQYRKKFQKIKTEIGILHHLVDVLERTGGSGAN